jgi:hypothetical protein
VDGKQRRTMGRVVDGDGDGCAEAGASTGGSTYRALGQRPGRPPTGTARDAVPPSLHARDLALENDGIGGGDLHGARRLIQA